MAAKAPAPLHRAVDEVFFRNEAVSLCLLINRRTRTMRIIDFRAGPAPAKRLFVLSLAHREGAEKVYTLVERDEVNTWVKLGFSREGSIPGFYKRSDAFLLGCNVPSPGRSRRAASRTSERARANEDVPHQSETRLVAAAPLEGGPPSLPDAQLLMERTVASAKRLVKEATSKAVPAAKVSGIGQGEAMKVASAAVRSGRALTAFEPFGRDVERRFFVVTAKGGFELHASIESQACFGNAYLELLEAPRTEGQRWGTFAALKALCDGLASEGVVSCFSLAPSDDASLASAFVHAGFRRTGLLSEHLLVGGQRKDAILWSRKLANPVDD
jgi:hypothetical protein